MDAGKLTLPIEHQLLVHLSKYPEVLFEMSQSYRLSLLAHYLFDLCQLYSVFYNEAPILKSDEVVRNARLGLTRGVEQVLENGLGIMGIAPVEEM
jgi:arginyl-tRNA synthetase